MNKLSVTLPFLLYIAGLGGLLVADLLVTSFLEDLQIAQWAAVRSFIGISPVLCLVGLDQVLVRSPESSFRILVLLLIQIPLVSGIIAWAYQFYDSDTSYMAVFLVSAATAGGLGLFQLYRSNGKRIASQWSQQSWKILVGAYLTMTVLQGGPINVWQTVAVVTVLSFLISLVPLRGEFPAYKDAPKSLGWIYSIGFRSLTSTLLLALSIYAEQLVVGSAAGVSQAADYFAHTTFFLLPVSVLNGYLAFNIAPWLRVNVQTYLRHKNTHGMAWLALIVVYAIALNVFGFAAWNFLRGETQSPDTAIQIAMLVSSIARTAYTFPAGFVGAFGNAKTLDGWIVFQTFSFGLAIAVYWLLSRHLHIEIIVAVAIASAINWVARTVVGFSICKKLEVSLA